MKASSETQVLHVQKYAHSTLKPRKLFSSVNDKWPH